MCNVPCHICGDYDKCEIRLKSFIPENHFHEISKHFIWVPGKKYGFPGLIQKLSLIGRIKLWFLKRTKQFQ